jgi:hypothetical protein
MVEVVHSSAEGN